MRRRVAVLLAMAAVTALLGACQQPAPANGAEPVYLAVPPYCPFDDLLIQSNGDSVGVGYTGQLKIPGYTVFNAAQGGGTFTVGGAIPVISERVKQWIEECGAPRLLVIEGGVIDVTFGVPLETIQAAVLDLSAWLEEQQIPTVWVGVLPFPHVSKNMVHDPTRVAYNQWLTTPGTVWGTAVDCTTAVEDPLRPGTMNPAYWRYVDIFGTPDSLHPTTAGYKAMAECVKPLVLDALAG